MSNWTFSSFLLRSLTSSWAPYSAVRSPPSTHPRPNPTGIECIICRSDSSEVEFAPSSPTSVCSHPPQACVGCLRQVILMAVTSGDFLSGILCPSPECSQRLDYHDVRTWATPEVFDRYDRLLLQDSLRTDGHYVHCLEPSCGAGQEHTGGESNTIVTCHYCGTKQCFRHQVLWHEGFTCEQWDEIQRDLATRQEDMTNEWIQTITKPCPGPGCGRRIQKDEGCDHMTCRRPAGCGHQFCWMCLAPWTPIIAGDNSRHYDNCVYYSGRPGNNPAPPEIVAALNPNRGSQNASATPIRGPILPPTLPLTVNRIEPPEEELDETESVLRGLRLRLAEELNHRMVTGTNSGPEGGALRPLRLVDTLVRPNESPQQPAPPRVSPIAPQNIAGPGPRTQAQQSNALMSSLRGNSSINSGASRSILTGSNSSPNGQRGGTTPNPTANSAIHTRAGGSRPQVPPQRGVPVHVPPPTTNSAVPTRAGGPRPQVPPQREVLVYVPPPTTNSAVPTRASGPRPQAPQQRVAAYVPPHRRGRWAEVSPQPREGSLTQNTQDNTFAAFRMQRRVYVPSQPRGQAARSTPGPSTGLYTPSRTRQLGSPN